MQKITFKVHFFIWAISSGVVYANSNPASIDYVNQKTQEIYAHMDRVISERVSSQVVTEAPAGTQGPAGPQGPVGPQGPMGSNAESYSAGKGITIQNGTISLEEHVNVTHAIGDKILGGTVFYINSDGTHGLVVANSDQGVDVSWWEAQDVISNPVNFDAAGQMYLDWRLPTKTEFNLLYQQYKYLDKISDNCYLSSTHVNATTVWCQSFKNGNQFHSSINESHYNVRAIRDF